MRIGITGPQDFLALLIRRKWWIVSIFLGLSGAVTVLTNFLPHVYVSETLILVRPRDVPDNLVMELIGGTTEERLVSIQQSVLSRTNLIQILREFGDSMPEFRGLNLDAAVNKLRDQINIEFQAQARGRASLPLTYFRISYQNQNPELAQKIAAKLTSLFIDQDSKVREAQVFGTTDFLTAELEKVSEALRASEARLKEVKSSRQFELPDQLETNLRTLDRLMGQKQTNTEALDRYATLRLNLESQISLTPAVVPLAAVAAPGTPVPPPDPLIVEYRKAELEYTQAAAKYTEKHPEVQAAKGRMERLAGQIPPDKLLTASTPAVPAESSSQPSPEGTAPNPLYQKLLAQLKEVNTEFAIREREKVWIEAEILKHSRRVENTPNTELQMADVVRENTELQKQYEDLKGKVSQAELSESLESKQKGEQFMVADPANYPIVPAKPNKEGIVLAGSLASLLIAMGIAALVDIARQRVWTQKEVEAFWGTPVLVDIPEILTDSDLAEMRKKRLVWAASSVAGVAAYGVCLYVVYWKHNFILQQLDPVIQSLVYR